MGWGGGGRLCERGGVKRQERGKGGTRGLARGEYLDRGRGTAHEYLRTPSIWADQMMTTLSAPPEAKKPGLIKMWGVGGGG